MYCLLVYPPMHSLPVWICMLSPHFLQDFNWNTPPSLSYLFPPGAFSCLAWIAPGRKKIHLPLCWDISPASRPGQCDTSWCFPICEQPLMLIQKLFGLDTLDHTSLGLGQEHWECSPCLCCTPTDNKKWVNSVTLEQRCRYLWWLWDEFWAAYGHIYTFCRYI